MRQIRHIRARNNLPSHEKSNRKGAVHPGRRLMETCTDALVGGFGLRCPAVSMKQRGWADRLTPAHIL
jgi:hypothetical protein